MTNYPGMTLRGEVRESVSLDEDDLSDVEDEVFIRDGKRGYKFAEEVGVKRPLMAPRRKTARPDLTARLKSKPPCRAFCKPCCYIATALSVLIGLIMLVVVLTSLFPLPLDKLKDWIVSKTNLRPRPVKLLPCSNVRVVDVWSATLPKLTSESPIRTLDVDQDGVEDVIFGYGTGDNANVLQQDVFCPVFLGIAPPCEGGVVALNGTNGAILWRRWMNDTIFSVSCNADVNKDGTLDCLVIGKKGTMAVLNSRTGYPIWETTGRIDDIFLANFIPDQDNDTVPDILSSHSQYHGNVGHLILLSGKTGNELERVELGRTYFMPQVFKRGEELVVLYGTGGPLTPGSLNVISLSAINTKNLTSIVLYADAYKGILTQSILVDITGDGQADIVTSMFNSTVVAINGTNLQQIWNYSVPAAESLMPPAPAYFNSDNITDFLVVYEPLHPTDNTSTQTFIIDGKTGKPIYEKPYTRSLKTQTGALSLRMSGYGNDMFVFWSKEPACFTFNGSVNATVYTEGRCSTASNASLVVTLNAMNQYDQPPGFEIYNSEKWRRAEFGGAKTALEEAIEFLRKHPERTNVGAANRHDGESKHTFKDGPGFRKTYNRKEPDGDYSRNWRNRFVGEPANVDEDYGQPREDINALVDETVDPAELDYNYDDPRAYGQTKSGAVGGSRNYRFNPRDPRSKENLNDPSTEGPTTEKPKTTKKNLGDGKYGIYDYRNVRSAKDRLLHDLNDVPTNILRDTYFRNRERKSRFEQRDLQSHGDRTMEQNEESTAEDERLASDNMSLNLWDLETEKELEDKRNGYVRGKRDASYEDILDSVTNTGAVTKSFNSTGNTIDIVFFTFWTMPRKTGEQVLDEHLQKCVNDKLNIQEGSAKSYDKSFIEEQAAIRMRECEEEYKAFKKDMPYYNQIYRLQLGRMTVYRLRLECTCQVAKKFEKCAKFLSPEKEGWTSFLGRNGDGTFH